MDETTKVPEIISKFQQRMLLLKYRLKCLQKLTHYWQDRNTTVVDGIKYCPPIFDNLLCWDAVPADSLVRQRCPNYYKGFDTSQYAYKSCTENGTWFRHPLRNRYWTNFSMCRPAQGVYTGGYAMDQQEMEENLRILYTTGYSISLFCLIIAVIIMFFCRRLQSKSNVLHINLFIALILRSLVALMKDTLFVMNRIGMKTDYKREPSGKLTFIEEGTHWECRLIISLLNFTICACNMWIFVEGLYLYMLIHKPLYTARKGVNFYIALGWILPILNIIPWVAVKATLENTHCWTIPENPYYFWILKGPGILVICINVFFFVDIIRILCVRMRSRDQHNGQGYRKLTKFILVLIPLFGVTYIIFYAVQEKDGITDYTYLYAEMTYNSFQGFILAFLFCFLNEDVHKELARVWHRRKNRMEDHLILTRSTLFSSWKKTSVPPIRAHSNSHSSHEHPGEHKPVERVVDHSDELYKHALIRNSTDCDGKHRKTQV